LAEGTVADKRRTALVLDRHIRECEFNAMPKGPSKPAEYPLATEGSRLAAKARAKCNHLSETKRGALFNEGMARIYGGAGKKATRAGH
jgi:hypothetical protein